MAAILIFRHICAKGIFFTFYFLNWFLLSIYFSKYLQFPLKTIMHWQNYITQHLSYEIVAFENRLFLFSQFLFSQLLRTLARKLMKRPAFFITYFQSPFQIVYVYQVSQSEYFFQKFDGHFKLIFIFLTLRCFSEETYEKTYKFYYLFSKFLSPCTLSQNFIIWKFLQENCWLCQNLNKFLLISLTFYKFFLKIKRPTLSLKYFQSSNQFIHIQKMSFL